MIPVEQVCLEARKLLGTPYQHQARVVGRGVDCIGVIVLVGRALGCCPADFDITHYPREPHNGMLVRLLDAHLQQIHVPKGAMPPVGAIAVMRWLKEPQHLGIIVEPPALSPRNFLHANGIVGHCVEHILDRSHLSRMVRYYAFPGVAYPAELLGAPVVADFSKPIKAC